MAIVLKGVLTQFNFPHNGRIYSVDVFQKHFRELEIQMRRKNRIEKLKKIN